MTAATSPGTPSAAWWHFGGSRPWDAVARIAVVVGSLVVAFFPLVALLATGTMAGASIGQGIVALALVVVGIVAGVQDPRPHRVNIHDREMDAIVGSVLLVVAIGLTWLLPTQMGDLVPLYRPDLLGAAAFLVGALCLTVGVRTACRCWPALLGLLVVHPVLVEAVLQPVMRRLAAFGVEVAGAVVAAEVTTDGAAAITAWATHRGTYEPLDLTAAVGAYSWVPVAVVVSVALAVVLHGPKLRRLALAAVGGVVVLAACTARIVVGVVVARTLGAGEQAWVHGAGGTLLALGAAGVVVVLVVGRSGLTWRPAPPSSPPAVPAPPPARRLALPVATGLLAVAAVAVAVLGTPAHAGPAPRYRSVADGDAGVGLTTVGSVEVLARTAAPSPYPAPLTTGSWRRMELSGTGSGTATAAGETTLDVVDVLDPDLLALHPPRLVYGAVAHDRTVQVEVTIAPGIPGVATTYLGPHDQVVLTAVSWAWDTADGRSQLVTLLGAGDPSATVPEPRVDVAGSLLPNVLGHLRGSELTVPRAVQDEIDEQIAAMVELADQLVVALEAS